MKRRLSTGPARLLAFVVSLWFVLGSGLSRADELQVTFFSVGQGDSLLIVSPGNKRVLIDGGPPESRQALLGKLRQRGVESLDLVLLTHPHLDHLGGLPTVIRSLSVRAFMDAGFPSDSNAYATLLKALEEQRVPVLKAAAGRKIDLGGGAMLTLLGPPAPFLQSARSAANANSVVTRLTYGAAAAIFMGDAELETEQGLLQRGETVLAGLLKVAHHGSKYASSAALLKAVQPKLAIISVGAVNEYNHPTPETITRLQGMGATVLRTDQQGDVTVRSRDGKPWEVVPGGPVQQTPPSIQAAQAPPMKGPPPIVQAPAHPAAQAPDAAGERVASQRSDVFHLPGCAAVARIKPENLTRFPSRAAALQSGRHPAVDCRP